MTGPRDAALTPGCLDDDMLSALAEGSVQAAERPRALTHLASCARCRGIVASVARALADSELAVEIRAVESEPPVRARRLVPIGLGVAAAAAVVLLLLPARLGDPITSHRAPPITASPAPQALFPVGRVGTAREFRWTAVAGADRYRVTLFDASGAIPFETELSDTGFSLPATVVLVPEQTYAWRVDARLGFDRWASSELIEFSVARPDPR